MTVDIAHRAYQTVMCKLEWYSHLEIRQRVETEGFNSIVDCSHNGLVKMIRRDWKI